MMRGSRGHGASGMEGSGMRLGASGGGGGGGSAAFSSFLARGGGGREGTLAEREEAILLNSRRDVAPRYLNDERTAKAMLAKSKMCDILAQFCDSRLDCRITLLLEGFRDLYAPAPGEESYGLDEELALDEEKHDPAGGRKPLSSGSSPGVTMTSSQRRLFADSPLLKRTLEQRSAEGEVISYWVGHQEYELFESLFNLKKERYVTPDTL